MQLTRCTKYALRVLIYSALHDRRATIQDMSCAYGISKNPIS